MIYYDRDFGDFIYDGARHDEDDRHERRGYDEARHEIVGSIVSICCICGDVAWTSYYGSYICRDCCSFYTKSIFRIAEYWCTGDDGNCEINRTLKKRCHFCWLKCCLLSDLDTTKFGDDYVHKNRTNRNRARTPLRIPRESVRQIREFLQCLDRKSIENSDFDELPIMFPNEEKLSDRLYLRYALFLIINDSLFGHGNLMLKRCFLDPYKCRVPWLQELTITMLDLAEWILEDGIFLNLPAIRRLIELEDEGNDNNWWFRYKLRGLEISMEFFHGIVGACYAQDVFQRW